MDRCAQLVRTAHEHATHVALFETHVGLTEEGASAHTRSGRFVLRLYSTHPNIVLLGTAHAMRAYDMTWLAGNTAAAAAGRRTAPFREDLYAAIAASTPCAGKLPRFDTGVLTADADAENHPLGDCSVNVYHMTPQTGGDADDCVGMMSANICEQQQQQ